MNSISLAQFRAQVGVQNYGEVVATNDGKLKTVNNGIFARNFKLFHQDISQDQACRTAVQFYNAIKGDFHQSTRTSQAFLESIAEELGVTVKGDKVFGDDNTKKLDRMTVKSVIQRLDAFKSMLELSLKKELHDAILSSAATAFVALDKHFRGNPAVTELLAKYPDRFIEEDKVENGAEGKTTIQNKVKFKNDDKGIPFLREVFQLKDDSGKLIVDNPKFSDCASWRTKTSDLIEDFENLNNLDVKRYKTVDDMVNDFRNGSADGTVRKLKSTTATNALERSSIGLGMLNQILSNKRKLHSFLDHLSSELTECGRFCLNDKMFTCRLSNEELKRVLLRQASRAVAKFTDYINLDWKHLTPDQQLQAFAEITAKSMIIDDYKAVFGISS